MKILMSLLGDEVLSDERIMFLKLAKSVELMMVDGEIQLTDGDYSDWSFQSVKAFGL